MSSALSGSASANGWVRIGMREESGKKQLSYHWRVRGRTSTTWLLRRLLARHSGLECLASSAGADSRTLAPHSLRERRPLLGAVRKAERLVSRRGADSRAARTPFASRTGPGSLLTAQLPRLRC